MTPEIPTSFVISENIYRLYSVYNEYCHVSFWLKGEMTKRGLILHFLGSGDSEIDNHLDEQVSRFSQMKMIFEKVSNIPNIPNSFFLLEEEFKLLRSVAEITFSPFPTEGESKNV